MTNSHVQFLLAEKDSNKPFMWFIFLSFLQEDQSLNTTYHPSPLDVAVELLCGVLPKRLARRGVTEAGRDLVEGAALGLRDLEVGEHEEAQQHHREDDEDVGATQLLR